MSASLDPPARGTDRWTDLPAQPRPVRIPMHFLRAIAFSAAATAIVGLPCMLGNELYSETDTLLILAAHFFVLIFPVSHILRVYSRRRDFFHPSFLAGLTFVIFHIVVNPLIYRDPYILASRNLDISSSSARTELILQSYLVLFVAWCGYSIGHALLSDGASIRKSFERPRTQLFLILAVVFVILGVIGNIGIIGGVGNYVVKMLRPWERWSEYIDASQEGGTKWRILMQFLPVGLLVLIYGIYLKYNLRPRSFYMLLLTVSIANVFLSCASGGRGTMLLTTFYGIVLVNHSVQRLSKRVLAMVTIFLVIVSFIFGELRGAAYYATEVSEVTNEAIIQFASMYMTNYLGTLTLVAQVDSEGIVNGATAFSALKGLLGGRAPVNTEAEIWYRLTGSHEGPNPRYGAPGELYFNYGWTGVLLGMILMGLVIKYLALAYERSEKSFSVGGGLMAAFAAFTSNFLMIANLSYLPSYFTYLSAPFYILFWLYRRRQT